MSDTGGRVALTKTLRDGRTATVTVTAIGYLHAANSTVWIDGKEAGSHMGAHHAAPQSVLDKAPGHVAAIGPLLLTAEEAAQVEAVYREVQASIPPDLDGARRRLADALDGAEMDLGINAAERMDAGYANPFAGAAEDEQRITGARAALAAFDAEHPEIAAKIAAGRGEAARRAVQYGD